ncbi:MAG: hypothetical protein ACOC4M_12105 [Promethearchaeia archaeon]
MGIPIVFIGDGSQNLSGTLFWSSHPSMIFALLIIATTDTSVPEE